MEKPRFAIVEIGSTNTKGYENNEVLDLGFRTIDSMVYGIVEKIKNHEI